MGLFAKIKLKNLPPAVNGAVYNIPKLNKMSISLIIFEVTYNENSNNLAKLKDLANRRIWRNERLGTTVEIV